MCGHVNRVSQMGGFFLVVDPPYVVNKTKNEDEGAQSRKQGAGSREHGAGCREQGAQFIP